MSRISRGFILFSILIKGGEKLKHIPLKWTDEELKYFNKPIMKAEQTNDWAWWVMLGALIVMEAMVVLKVLGKI